MSCAIRRYIREKEVLEERRGFTDLELTASELRKKFLLDHVVNFDTYLYKTQIERDWGYIAKREFRYDVTIKSLAFGFFWGNAATIAAIYTQKKMVWWTLPVFTFIGYLYWKPIFF